MNGLPILRHSAACFAKAWTSSTTIVLRLANISAASVREIPFRDETHAIEIANDVNYGLTGYVWTGDMGRALRVADALEAGMIWLNSENVRHLPTPFGGMKASGIGRDGGDYSFDFYMETKHVSLARGTHKIQKLGI